MNASVASSPFFTRVLLSVLGASVFALAWLPGASAQQAPEPLSQTSDVGGVTVTVKPKPIEAGTRQLVFGVALDTHSQALDDDLSQAAILVVDGAVLKPARSSGGAPGGHHRDIALTFDLPSPDFKTVEMRIQRPGESSPRTFRWDGTAWR